MREKTMKLTKEQADYIRSKKSFKSEGIVKSIFGRLLKKKLKKVTLKKDKKSLETQIRKISRKLKIKIV